MRFLSNTVHEFCISNGHITEANILEIEREIRDKERKRKKTKKEKRKRT